MILKLPSPIHFGIAYKYKLTPKQIALYQNIVQDQPLTSAIIHQLLIAGVLTTEIKEL